MSEGHPDKLADRISDRILDEFLARDPHARVACETLLADNFVVVAGEFKTRRVEDFSAVRDHAESLVRQVLREAGYRDAETGIDPDKCEVQIRFNGQSQDISQGVDRTDGVRGAGDQGLMFGYACDETPELMPAPITFAHRLVRRQADLRKAGVLPWLQSDAKSQVTFRYGDGRPACNAASQHVRPPLSPTSQNIRTDQGLVLVVTVALGLNKPYMDLQGRVWVKNGADKRHVTAREEMQRMFQASGLLQADQVPVREATWADIDERAFARYVDRRYKQSEQQTDVALPALFENLRLASDGVPNLAGVLLFGKNPERQLHVCMIAAVCFPGTKLSDSRYLDSENIEGSLEEQYQRGLAFIRRNLHHVQGDQGFNSLGLLEVPEEAFVELLVNALVHRDFFTNATIRLFVFADRVEIISPGHLSDSLTPEQIRAGTSNRRNKVLAEHAAHILPYRGLGTGIPRALVAWPRIDLLDEREANQFRAVVWRPQSEKLTEQVTQKPVAKMTQVTGEVTGEVRRLLAAMAGEMKRSEIQVALGLKHQDHFRDAYLLPALASKVIVMTEPNKPRSSKQRYRLTAFGEKVIQQPTDAS